MSHSGIVYSKLGQRAKPPVIADLMAQALEVPGLLSLAAGFTDNETLPVKGIQKNLERLINDNPDKGYLQYGTNEGRAGVRKAALGVVGSHPNEELYGLDESNVIISNGSQQALYLAMQTLCDEGDIVLVERPSYFVFLELLQGMGINAVSMPYKAEGQIDFDALGDMLTRWKVSGEIKKLKAVYLVGYFANPSARCITRETKKSVAQTFIQHDLKIPVIEDAAYREIYFHEPWLVPSIHSLPEFAEFPRLYTGTFSKPYATGLKVGFGICSDKEWRAKMLSLKGHQDFGTAHLNQCLVESMYQSCEYETHLASIQKYYLHKWELMRSAMDKYDLASLGWSWEEPRGGLLMWASGPDSINTGGESAFWKACLDEGVLYVPGELCFGDNPSTNNVRLSYGVIADDQIDEAVARFACGTKRLLRSN